MSMQRLLACLTALHLAAAPALASQNQLSSPTTGTVSGLQLTNNYNSALDSLNTCNSGTSAPTNQLSGTPSEGNCWQNTTASPHPRQYFDGAQWLTPVWLDTVNHLPIVQIGGGTNTVASAATTDLCSVPQAYLTITGNNTITSFGSTCKAGASKLITFSGALTLTYNATSLMIPGAANVTTSAGDQALVTALGSGNWQVTSYTPATGQALVNPAIPVGAKLDFFGPAAPANYQFAFGQAVSRTTFASLLTAVTITQSVTRTNGSPTLTGFSDTTQIGGGGIEGAGIPTGTSISSCTVSTCTMTQNATSSGTANVTIFPFGDGDGSTTFNLPDCRGVATAGRDNMGGTPRGKLTNTYALANPDALGVTLGAQNHTLALGETPSFSYTPAGSVSVNLTSVPPDGGGVNEPNTGGTISVVIRTGTPSASGSFTGTPATLGGSGNAHSIVPPLLTTNCLIRSN